MGGGVEQPEALLVGLERNGFDEVGEDLLDGGYHLGQRRGDGPEVAAQRIEVGLQDQGLDRFCEGTVGRRPFPLETVAPEHLRAVPLGFRCQFLGQAGLPHARFSRHQHHSAPAGGRLGQALGEAAEFGLTADERHPGRDPEDGDLRVHLGGRYGLRDAFEVQLAELGEAELAAPGQERGHDVAAQDLSRLGLVTQAPGDHDGGAEVVGGVPDGLAGVEAHSDGKALTVDRTPGGGLHGQGGPHGIGG